MKALVWHVATYGCESWTFGKNELTVPAELVQHQCDLTQPTGPCISALHQTLLHDRPSMFCPANTLSLVSVGL